MTVMRSVSGKLAETHSSFPAVTQDFCLSNLLSRTSHTAASLNNLLKEIQKNNARPDCATRGAQTVV